MSKFNNDDDYVCPVFATNGKCGDQDALRVMEQFKDFYEGKLNEIDIQGGGDCLELKLKIQRRWIDDLTEQTQMMARIVKELEDEATTRVRMLEDKLRQTSKSAYENKEKEAELLQKLQDARNTIKKMRPCVDLKSIALGTDDFQSDYRRREKELEDEIRLRQGEVDNLKCKCKELEEALTNTLGRAENLQKADARATCKGELKKLRRQNRYYAHVIECFKNEMTVMSEQLVHLQEILNLSNVSCREESGQLHCALIQLQNMSEKLQAQLVDTEKRVLIENQKNQLKDAKIDELQLIIGQKNADLNVHDEAINEMKMKLENTLMENHELQATVAALNSTVMQLQVCLQSREVARARKKSQTVSCKRSLSDCRDEMRKKNKKVNCVETIHQELEKIKEKSKDKIKSLKRQNEELKDKLATSELANNTLVAQIKKLKEQVAHVSQADYHREHELAQSKQIILELRQNLIELNESLADSELHHMTLLEEFHKSRGKASEQNDLYLSCQCEIALHKKLADSLKSELTNAKTKLTEIEERNRSLNEEIKRRDAKVNDVEKKAAKKEKENCQCIEELREKLKESQEEEKRLSDFIETLRCEVQKKLEQKKQTKQVLINCCDCNNMSATQEEINSLKIEIKNMIENQLALNNENDKLLKQVTSLQTTVATLEEKNRHLRQKCEKLQSENQSLKEKNKKLVREKENYTQTIRNLEAELTETKNCRDDLCAESKQVVSNVKAWLDEQRKINDRVRKKTKCYCDTISKLRQENEGLLGGRPLVNSAYKAKFERQCRGCTPADCPYNYLYPGSQGTDSPRESVMSCSCSVEEWYSPNYRDDDETEEEADNNFVISLEAAAQEMRNNNRKFRNKYQQEFVVSRDQN